MIDEPGADNMPFTVSTDRYRDREITSSGALPFFPQRLTSKPPSHISSGLIFRAAFHKEKGAEKTRDENKKTEIRDVQRAAPGSDSFIERAAFSRAPQGDGGRI